MSRLHCLCVCAILAGCGDRSETEEKRDTSSESAAWNESELLLKFHKLKLGMTPNEIEAVAGEPITFEDYSGCQSGEYVKEHDSVINSQMLTGGAFLGHGIQVLYIDGKATCIDFNPFYVDHVRAQSYLTENSTDWRERERRRLRWVSERTRRTSKAEQAGAGQPATRPESDLEGGDKPKPESEGRSR
jgi:hypothetical protein